MYKSTFEEFGYKEPDFSKSEDQEKINKLNRFQKKQLMNDSFKEASLMNDKIKLGEAKDHNEAAILLKEEDLYKEGLHDAEKKLNKFFEKNMKDNIKKLHDQYHPKIIFMTQTSSILVGYGLKELWKQAWPEEEPPKFLTIDANDVNVHDIDAEYKSGVAMREGDGKYERWKRAFTNRLARLEKEVEEPYCPNKEEKIAEIQKIKNDFDNKQFSYYDFLVEKQIMNTESVEFKNLQEKIKNKLSKFYKGGNVAVIDECGGFYGGSGDGHIDFNKPEFEPKEGMGYWGERQQTLATSKKIIEKVLDDLKEKAKVIPLGLTDDVRIKGGPWRRGENRSVRRVNTEEERREAMLKIKAFEEVGRKVGQEIREEEKNK